MCGFLTQLLISLVLLGFFLVSCQNLMHIAQGSVRFVLKHIHRRLDKELGESEGLSSDEEALSTRVVRRRVFVQVVTSTCCSPEESEESNWCSSCGPLWRGYWSPARFCWQQGRRAPNTRPRSGRAGFGQLGPVVPRRQEVVLLCAWHSDPS